MSNARLRMRICLSLLLLEVMGIEGSVWKDAKLFILQHCLFNKKNWFANIYIVIHVKIILYGLPNRS